MNRWFIQFLYVVCMTILFFVFCLVINALCNWIDGSHTPLAETMCIMTAATLFTHMYQQDHKD